ncbi:hypothetical protein KKA14_21940 [bacterium]|nr:hypothetical protein [bacterium]
MTYRLIKRETKRFELYNDLVKGDKAELGFNLKVGEEPRRKVKKIHAEQIWVEIDKVAYDTKNIYQAVLNEEPRFLKHIRRGDTIVFSPENVLKAKRKQVYKKAKNIKDFVYQGSCEKKQSYKSVISNGQYSYAVNPSKTVVKTKKQVKGSIPVDHLEDNLRKELENIDSRFEKVELDKYNVKINLDFIKKTKQRIKARKIEQDKNSLLIRISDRTFLSFSLVNRILSVLKEMFVYLEIYDEQPMLYFRNNTYEGFINLAKQEPNSVIVDLTEMM